jgi:hypothetical protein
MKSNVSNPQVERAPAADDARLEYQAPQLVRLGDVRDLTLGGSPGIGDSGNAGVQRF